MTPEKRIEQLERKVESIQQALAELIKMQSDINTEFNDINERIECVIDGLEGAEDDVPEDIKNGRETGYIG